MVAQTRATVGGLASGTGNITPALPSGWQPDDILVLFVESANEAVSAPTGWTQAANSPVSQTNADVTRLSVFWRRGVGGDGNPTITDPGDHAGARIIAVSGCVTSGDPWEATAGAPDNASTTTADIPTGTTSEKNGLVVVGVATGLPGVANSAQHSAWTNAGLLQGPSGPAGMVERFDSRYTAGNGGSIGCATGQLLDAGAVGTTTSTMAAADTKACWSGVLKSALTPIEFMTSGSSSTDGTSFATASIAPTADSKLVAFVLVSGTAVPTPTLTGLSLTWTLGKVITVGGTGTKLAYYTAPVGGSPSVGAVTISLSGTSTGACWSIYKLNGAGASAIVQDPSTAAFAANVTLNFSAAADAVNRQVVAVAVIPQNTQNSITPEAGWTEDAEVVRSTPNAKLWTARQLTTFDTSITVADDSSYDYGAIGLEVNFVTSADATATPAVIATSVALPRAAVNVAPVPAAVATTTALPASNLNVSAGPAVAATSVAVPQAAVNVSAGPAAIPTAVALPSATPAIGITAAPAVVAATVALPPSGVNVAAAPAVVASTVAVLPPALNVSASPSVAATSAAIPPPAVNVAAAPSALAVVVGLPTPTAGQSGSNATATPDAIATVASVPAAGVNVAAGPSALGAVVAMPQATPSGTANAAPATIAAVSALASPAVNVTASPAVTLAAMALARPNIDVSAGPVTAPLVVTVVRPDVNVTAGPAVLLAATSLPQAVPLAGGNATAAPVTITAAVAMPQATPTTGATVLPATIAAAVSLARAAVSAAAAPGVIAALAELPQASVGVAATANPATISTLVALARAGIGVSADPQVVAVLVTIPGAIAGQESTHTIVFVAGPPKVRFSAGSPGGNRGGGPRVRSAGGGPRAGGYSTLDDGFGEGPFGDTPFGG